MSVHRETRTRVPAGGDNRAIQKTPELLHCPCSGTVPHLKDWSHFSRGKSCRPEARGGWTAGSGVAGGAASTVDGKPPGTRLGKEGTMPRILEIYVKLGKILCLYFIFSIR